MVFMVLLIITIFFRCWKLMDPIRLALCQVRSGKSMVFLVKHGGTCTYISFRINSDKRLKFFPNNMFVVGKGFVVVSIIPSEAS